EGVNDQLRQSGRCLVVVSEGFDIGQQSAAGGVGSVRDAFGHPLFGASRLTVAQVVVNYLNEAGLAAKGAARGNVPGTEQRHSMAYASTVDLDEAYAVGQTAVELAAAGQSGSMATILRNPGETYSVRYDKVPLAEVANSERNFPAPWIAPSGCDVTDAFVRYARPLVGDEMLGLPLLDGRPHMTRFAALYAQQKLPKYVPQADRGGEKLKSGI
ncbi:MAG: 6-phosphofructokinase, partial [Thermoguttaceae bacterium]